MAQPSQELSLRDFLKQFDSLVAQGKWGSVNSKKSVERTIVRPLKERIRKDLLQEKEHERLITALNSLVSNPHSLRDFAERVFTGRHRNTTFTVCSLSKINSAEAFNNLGISIITGYSIDAMLRVAQSVDFRKLHACPPINGEKIPGLNGTLRGRQLLYPGDSEHVARAIINAHIEFLFDLNHLISSMLELWLARLSPEHQPVLIEHTDGNRTHRTYLTGRTDYMVLTLTRAVRGLPSPYITEIDREEILQSLELANCPEYSRVPGHLVTRLGHHQDWEALFLEAKSTSLFSQGRLNWSYLYQIIATCCIARTSSQGARTAVKFSLSSGRHWIFGVMDNDTATAYVTVILDNSDFRRTHDVIRLLILWMVLPGPMLKDHLFAKLTPQPQPKTGAKSQAGTSKAEEAKPKAEGEEGVLDKLEEVSAKEESRRADTEDEAGDSGTEDDEGEGEGGEKGEDDAEEIESCEE